MHKPLSRSVPLAAFLALCAPAGAQQGGEAAGAGGEANHPLNLSLPRDAVWAAPAGSTTADRRDRNSLPDTNADIRNPERVQGRQGQDGSGSMPYGAGYEARQRNSGRSGGMGRGMGRGR